MVDREKVIRGTEICLSGGLPQRCIECPYHNDGCDQQRMIDTLKLLKEQPKIVRCADCKHIERINGINGCGYRCELWEYSSVLKDGFCNYGERKDKQNG